MSQHMVALARANEVRFARARFKREVAAGERSVAELLTEPPDTLGSATVGEVVLYQPGWGLTRMRKALAGLMISESRTVAGLTERQRALVGRTFDTEAALA